MFNITKYCNKNTIFLQPLKCCNHYAGSSYSLKNINIMMSSYITTSVKITSTLVSLSMNKLTVAMFILFREQRYKIHMHFPPQHNGYLLKHQLITLVFYCKQNTHTHSTSVSYHMCPKICGVSRDWSKKPLACSPVTNPLTGCKARNCSS